METEILQEKRQQLIPKLRFKEFEGEWKINKLGSITTYVDYRGKGPEKSTEGVFLVTAKNIKQGFINYEISKEYIPLKNYSSVMSKGEPEVGDILFTTEAPLGNIAMVDSPNIALAQRVIKLRVKEQLWNSYLLFYMLSPNYQKLIIKKAIGTTVLGISGRELHRTAIKLPSLPEQQKIASFLSAVDKKIQQLTRKKALLETYKKGVMQKLFSQEIRFKDQNGKEFPEWKKKKLGDLADRITQKNTNDKINFVLTNSATQGIISQNDYFDRDIANQNNLQGYYVVSKDDFVYNPRISVHAPVGPIKRNKLREGVMSPLYSVFRFKDDKNLVFFEYFFETVLWHKYLNSVANFGARHDRMNISLNDFYLMPIPFPAVEEQRKIADFLSAIDYKIEAVTQQIEKNQTFKKGLLQQMFV
ncbi:restriction endonuclease subunit S [Zunongwangia sp. H14]|uniref:restriction endonuclease subunit S n=1 Tax=Zunongwangia sp. H14 TaxID=3240792 RepID=UPI0035615FF9